eukprot:TRINITY_DN14735_c0_g1_i1.p1 TRINITY_DN14735_c0_g1~~TRINITY_DN14735_c0_g1_i1.p1  ORF type:complete len:482 (+),score=95.71 TRINITY_DN14735_c0_g1_i1:41-1486(+)
MMSVWGLVGFVGLVWLYVLKVHPVVKRARSARTVGIGFWYSLKSLVTQKLCENLKLFVDKKDLRTGFYHVWLGNEFTLLTTDPDCAQNILKSKDLLKTPAVGMPKFFADQFAQNLVFTNGDTWKAQRRAVSGGFIHEAIQSYYPTFNQLITKFLSILSALPQGDVDMGPYLTKFTLDLLGKSIFHYDFNNMTSDHNPHYKAYQETVKGDPTRLLYFLSFYEKLPLPGTKRLLQATLTLKQLFDELIEDHKSQGDLHRDVLDKLLRAQQEGGGLSEVELYSNLWILFVAGHETTAMSLSWAVVELAARQDIQEKLYQVVMDHYPTEPTFQSILDPPAYLDGFIKENLRVHPPLPILPSRKASKDLHLAGQFVPSGTLIGLDIHGIHHNPNHWTNPEQFDPDRFLPERRKGQHKFAYLPFSMGPRQCLGKEFSEIEQCLLLVRLLREFKILPPQNHPKTDLNAIPIIGSPTTYYVTLQKRTTL